MKHSDEQVRQAVVGAKSVADVMRRLGLNCTGYGHARFKKRLLRLGLKVETKAPWNKGKIGDKKPTSFYLKKGGNVITSSKLRRRLIEDGLKKEECEECRIGPFWNNKPLTLQLDHIDGDRDNNEISNLRIICPNCHTQTKTYSKMKTHGDAHLKKVYNCKRCNQILRRKTKTGFCIKCLTKVRTYRRKVKDRPSKEILLQQIEERGYCATGRLYGVTDNCVRKWLHCNN